jgi:hypothetical protein
MTLRGAAWLCLGSGAGLLAFAWDARDIGYSIPAFALGFLALMSGSHLLTAAIQMPRDPPGDDAST